MDGKLSTKAPLTLKVAYDGPEAKVTVGVVHDLVWLFAEYRLDVKKKENLLATVEVAEAVFDALREKGVKYVYCMADNVGSFKFNELLGFKSVNAVVQDKHEVMEKEL